MTAETSRRLDRPMESLPIGCWLTEPRVGLQRLPCLGNRKGGSPDVSVIETSTSRGAFRTSKCFVTAELDLSIVMENGRGIAA